MPRASVKDFATAVRQEYPGKFDDVSDDELVHAVVQESPDLGNEVDLRTYKPTNVLRAPKTGERGGPRNDLEAMHQFAIGAGKGMIEGPYDVYKGVANVLQGRPAGTTRNADFEDALKSENRAQTVGKVGESVGEFALGEGAINAGAKVLRLAPKARLLLGAGKVGKTVAAAGRVARAATVGAATAAAHEESPAVGAIAGGAGAIVGEGVGAIARSPLAEKLIEGAKQNWNRLLGATTDLNKRTAAKVVPEMVDRGIVVGSRKGAADYFEAQANDFGQQIDNIWQNLPADKEVPAKDILDAIDTAKAEFQVPGGQKVQMVGKQKVLLPPQTVNVEPQVVRSFNRMKGIVDAATDDTTGMVNIHSLRRIRGAWDEIVSAKGGFVKDLSLPDRAGIIARREAANAIREEIGKAVPDLRAINKEYTLWRRAEKIMRDTLTRTSSQSQPLGQQVMKVAGAAANAKAGAVKALITGQVAATFRKVTTSAAWNSVAATTKKSLATAIAAGDRHAVRRILGSIAFSIGSATQQPPAKEPEMVEDPDQ